MTIFWGKYSKQLNIFRYSLKSGLEGALLMAPFVGDLFRGHVVQGLFAKMYQSKGKRDLPITTVTIWCKQQLVALLVPD